MNRLKKAFSLDRGEKSLVSDRQKKRFSLFNNNKSGLSVNSAFIDNSQMLNPSNRLNLRSRSTQFDAESIQSFFTTTTIETNNESNNPNDENEVVYQESIRSLHSTGRIPNITPPRRRSKNFLTTEDFKSLPTDNTNNQSDLTENDDEDSCLQMGMKYHEQGELEKATYYWRLSAQNGVPLGLFFYGVALRHGWGCKKNPTEAVKYLQSAAECAVYDLQTGIAQSISIAKSELVLAIYELGVCFRHGWGVPKDLGTAAYYFQIASNLGDPDAQNDLGFCYTHGLGVKKDLYFAARYYRLAEKQGQGIIGNSWIWKEKYNQVDEPGWNGRIK